MERRRRRQWGKGSITRKASGDWQVRWREGGRRRVRGGFATRDDAERVLDRILGDLAQGRTGLPADPRRGPRLGDLAPDFLARLGLGWYEATRHTFASQWVMAGGSIEKLKEILGHYSVVMTERYAHLKPELFTPKDMAVIDLDLAAGPADSPTLLVGRRV